MSNPSVTVDQVIAALADFLQPFMPNGVEIVRAQVNRVSMPIAPCVILTELLQVQLETVSASYDVDGSATYLQPCRIDVQMDFYDGSSSEMCRIAQTMLRSRYATEAFPDGIKPLYCSDGIQAPLITAEQLYESRWTLTVSLQYNSAVTVTEQQFDSAGETAVYAADIETSITE